MLHYSELIESLNTRHAESRIHYDGFYDEYRVRVYIHGRVDDSQEYFTIDIEDAQGVARMLCDWAEGVSSRETIFN